LFVREIRRLAKPQRLPTAITTKLSTQKNLYNILVERVLLGGKIAPHVSAMSWDFIGIKDYFNQEAEEAFDLDGNEVKGVLNGAHTINRRLSRHHARQSLGDGITLRATQADERASLPSP
jgi:hypothetical protein